MFHKIIEITNKHKIVRGILSYGILWPTGNLVEQTLVEKRNFKTYDWNRCLRFSLFGALYMGPTMYVWLRLASTMWPKTEIRSSLCKALCEQLAYDPMMIVTFLYGMTLMEGKSKEDAKYEVKSKFIDTYKIGVIYWPIVQTFNFTLIPAKNQVVFTSVFSMFWTSFLAYIKSIDIDHHVDVDQHINYHFEERLLHLLEIH